ncbi:bifunctional 4-hydroxy-2-oxoglutarate aldolase/2-dehydro-3-deoxy-phosphogluconate aldolase [Pseudohongiella sp.]|uniref:2-dehydro-3-deoxy-phosphogluconate aldolase n=1 Tax=marine sediment metagenome TaxID=412755 RepID=A0A0F9YE98_9ZZZZ|nr:bifunctional 4-hydroxy-2-oxoglutarate aldolase/2-dehydro-3-deoxy-phosphogluconate aldolase [Pseudohongiella sp.]HDZ09774.1 bifunctional 4-hydroxy-2-oxoglutarate aldolase/2-dehydro-3-deoxy-phosphogluconate aldolase [Pseudohongiella sp.]HEA61612.1 bifunctional 4-hydroxy-2-oxoglutarate aldolase/2-dehydro-3-deoxy-phosphogluconate aldolase [Pseudohongiella sp.]
MSHIREQLNRLTILPVLVVNSEAEAVSISQALFDAGIGAVEITLRTPAALAAIQAVKQAIPSLVVAAGTVNTVADMEAVAGVDVDFAVSPGLTSSLAECARALELPFLPGVSTASEVLGGMELGFDCFKFFPASACGGPALLKALSAPLAGVSFCPTGGINASNAGDYLALPNVLCVGGSWMLQADSVAAADWVSIRNSTRDSLAHLARFKRA